MNGSALLATLLVVLADAGGPFANLAPSRRPPRLEPLWAGLGPAYSRGAPSTSGIVALRLPMERRVRIAGGQFVMGSTDAEMTSAQKLCAQEPFGALCASSASTWAPGPLILAEGHPHEVTLGDFELDATEVTVRTYLRCVAAGSCAPPAFPSGDGRYDHPEYPITHVRWEDAEAYCAWIGGRLPTEAEWERAARGVAGRTFPWGELYNPHLANHGAQADDPTDGRDGFVGLAPVGSFPDGATPTGLFDMAGNAAEWVSDWYDRDEGGFGYGRGAQSNPKGPTFGPYGHVIRGGSYRDPAYMLRTAARRASPFATREIGFRCAYGIAASAPTP